jgi:hypothetical protein
MGNPAHSRHHRHLAFLTARMINLSLSMLLLGLAVPRVGAQERRTDFLGDPLPERALVRIGTTRLQRRYCMRPPRKATRPPHIAASVSQWAVSIL